MESKKILKIGEVTAKVVVGIVGFRILMLALIYLNIISFFPKFLMNIFFFLNKIASILFIPGIILVLLFFIYKKAKKL